MRIELNVQQSRKPVNSGGRGAFTILELLFVFSIIIVVTGLLTLAMNQAKSRTLRVSCLDNMKQLQLAWILYADDHNDYVALNKTTPSSGTTLASSPRSSADSWVTGNPKEDRTSDNIARGTLYPYVKQPEVYRCPMDNSITRFGTQRTRSYSISGYLGGDDDDLDPRVKMRLSELVNPAPERIFVFIEEHEDSIWAGGFLVIPKDRTSITGTWSSIPSDRHMQGCNLTFADGHLEYWKWSSPKKANLSNQIISSGSDLKDLRRLQAATPK